MELMSMRKKKVWIAGCTVFLLLLICTVLSLRVEKMMRIEVETVSPIQCTEEELIDMFTLPVSCFKEDEFGTALYYVEEQEGLFGKELYVVKDENAAVMWEEGNKAYILSQSARNDQGKLRKIVDYSAWPLEDGDAVVIAGEE